MNPSYLTGDQIVDQVVGSAYQTVKYVAANMESILLVAQALPSMEGLLTGYTDASLDGESPVKQVLGSDLVMRSMVAGTNMSIVVGPDGNSLVFAAASGGGGGGTSLKVTGADENDDPVSQFVGEINFFDLEFELEYDPTGDGSMQVFLNPTGAAQFVHVQGEDGLGGLVDSFTTGGIAFDPDFFAISEVGGVAMITSTGGGGGGGGMPVSPDDGNQYVGVGDEWVEYFFNQDSIQNMGTISLVSPDDSVKNRMKFRGLRQTDDSPNFAEVTLIPEPNGGSGLDNNIKVGLGRIYKSAWDGYFDNGLLNLDDARVPMGAMGQVDTSLATPITAFTANTVYLYPVYFPYPTSLTMFSMPWDDATQPFSGTVQLSLMKYKQNNMEVIKHQSYNWSDVASGNLLVSPAWAITEPGLYMVAVRTSVTLAALKIGRLMRPASGAYYVGKDPASMIMNLRNNSRGSVAWKGSSGSALTVGSLVNVETYTAVTEAPFLEGYTPASF